MTEWRSARLFFCASCLCAGVAAAQEKGDIFPPPSDQIESLVSPAQQVKESIEKGRPAAFGQISEAGEPETFRTATEHHEHGKGFISRDNSDADFQSFEAFEGRAGRIPDTFDLRPSLTPIEDQGKCGDCWAFSLTALMRDGLALDGNDPGRLSQEWLADNSKEATGCNGGGFQSAKDLVRYGQPAWDECPYTAGTTGTITARCPLDLAPAARISGWHMLGKRGQNPTVRDIEAYMAMSGKPVVIAIAAGGGKWEDYAGGVYNGCKAARGTDHMMNIVGWDNEGARFDEKGNLPPGKGIWILRNSWGTSWGEDGYMRTKMTDRKGSRCNEVAREAAYFDF
jgi:cathepsin L